MNNTTYILSHILEYLKLKEYLYKQNLIVISLECPKCAKTARFIKGKHLITCSNCNTKFTLITIVRKIEPDKKSWSKEKIVQYLNTILNLNVITKEEINNWFNYFEENGFSMLQLVRGDKSPVAASMNWEITEHKDKKEWNQWITDFNANIGLQGGKISNNTIIDIDCLTKKEEQQYIIAIKHKDKKEIKKWKEKIIIPPDFEKIMGEPLIQKTFKGFHLIYLYEPELRSCKYKFKEIDGEIRNDKQYIVIFPSGIERREEFADGTKKTVIISKRTFITKPKKLTKIPDEFKQLLFSLKTKKNEGIETEEYIRTESFNYKLIKPGMMGRSNMLTQIGGCYRKKFNHSDTEFLLQFMNKHFFDPPLSLDVLRKTVFTSLNKYRNFDEEKLAQEILHHLRNVGNASRAHLTRDMELGGRKIAEILNKLVKEELIIKNGNIYSITNEPDWQYKLTDIRKPINYKMPFFYDIAKFYHCDQIIIGAPTGIGKTHIAIEIIRQLVQQGICPYYFSKEAGSGFVETALQLGLKEKNFWYWPTQDPTKWNFRKNAVTIIDWWKPKEYHKTEDVLDYFNGQMMKNQGILILFVQLRDNGMFYAKDMMEHFASLTVKYFYDEPFDGKHGRFEIGKIRNRLKQKVNKIIPCTFDWYTKILSRNSEIESQNLIITENQEELIGGNNEEK